MAEAAPAASVAFPRPAELRARLRAFRLGALLILGASAVPLLTGGQVLPVLAGHVAWALWVFGCGEALRVGRLPVRHAGVASTLGAMLFLPYVLSVSGAAEGVLYLALVSLPLLVAAMSAEDPPAVVVSGVAGAAWVLVFEVRAGHAPERVLAWTLFAAAFGALGFWATVLRRRIDEDRARAEAERLDALRRLAQQERRASRDERLTLVGQLAGSIAHDVNNPLSFVLANLRFLDASAQGESKEVLAEMREGLERIGATVRTMQLFVQDDAGPREARVSECLDDALLLARPPRASRAPRPRATVPQDLPAVAMGQRQLTQVLVAVLLHAFETSAASEPRQVEVFATAGEGELEVTVEHPGAPAPLVASPRLTPADQPLGHGGLALALCREHVQGAGGRLDAHARDGGGGRIVLRLPVVARAPGPGA